jgi:uncharacterized protein (DUF2147 family)
MNRKLLIISLFISSLCFAQNQILGKWLTQDKDAYVELFQQKGKYYGKIVWLKHPNDNNGKPSVDDKNPEASLRSTPIIGLNFLKDFVYAPTEKQWIDGHLYDPKTGKSYKGTLWLEDANTLKVRGYLGFIYNTVTWTRVK